MDKRINIQKIQRDKNITKKEQITQLVSEQTNWTVLSQKKYNG
jgi:hypothetical protein